MQFNLYEVDNLDKERDSDSTHVSMSPHTGKKRKYAPQIEG